MCLLLLRIQHPFLILHCQLIKQPEHKPHFNLFLYNLLILLYLCSYSQPSIIMDEPFVGSHLFTHGFYSRILSPLSCIFNFSFLLFSVAFQYVIIILILKITETPPSHLHPAISYFSPYQ